MRWDGGGQRAGGRGGGEGGGRGAESYERKKFWPSVNYSLLSGENLEQ
jgi:hypothetical protein